jgi:hypothetical protein
VTVAVAGVRGSVVEVEDAAARGGFVAVCEAASGARLRARLGALGLSLLAKAALGVRTVSSDTPRGCHDGLHASTRLQKLTC